MFDAVTSHTPARRPGATAGRTRKRILVAEDDTEMRRLIARVLRYEGYDIVEANSGSALLDALVDQMLLHTQAVPFDLVISDLRMPGLTGMDVLRWLRSEDWVLPYILITAFGSPAVEHEALWAGADAILAKPFELDHLRATVQALIGGMTAGGSPL